MSLDYHSIALNYSALMLPFLSFLFLLNTFTKQWDIPVRHLRMSLFRSTEFTSLPEFAAM